MHRLPEGKTDVVVLGLGHVGLTVIEGVVRAGLSVIGYDINDSVVDALNRGESPSSSVSPELVSELLSLGFRATVDASVIQNADAAAICVPTPLSKEGALDRGPLMRAVETIAAHLHPGMLVVIESTLCPGMTEGVVRSGLEYPGLRAGRDFYLAISPSRMDLGNSVYQLKNTPKVVGGCTNACAEQARVFYSRFVDTVLAVSSARAAEMTKLLENAYRHVNIALVNEVTQLCHGLSVDAGEVVYAASTKPFGFAPFYPGPGVGGCCAPIESRPSVIGGGLTTYPLRIVEVARDINRGMPLYIVKRAEEILAAHEKRLSESSVLLLGVTYKANVAHTRESPAVAVVRELFRRGGDVFYHDPYIREWSVDGIEVKCAKDLHSECASVDLTILLQAHQIYNIGEIAYKSGLFLDMGGKG